MGNYWLMAAWQHGCPKVLVNKTRQTQSRAVKKSKKGEIYYLPDPPEGLSTVQSKENQTTVLLKVQKCDLDLQLLDELMMETFCQ
ncbi:uncharacterized protein LOC111836274 [Scomber scombrus]|uniref:Uncharacterized protein LOC111836274 n=1 Tax=Scomber scombrus TaxID=13677 RepID=A0AAV1N132_SCOSC